MELEELGNLKRELDELVEETQKEVNAAEKAAEAEAAAAENAGDETGKDGIELDDLSKDKEKEDAALL